MITKQTGERLRRLAFELERLADRLREAGMGDEARGLKAAAQECSHAGDSVLNRFSGSMHRIDSPARPGS